MFVTFVVVAFAGLFIGFLSGVELRMWVMKKRGLKFNSYLWDMAEHYYGDQWAEAIIKCQRNHLPGTCVLCGGESL